MGENMKDLTMREITEAVGGKIVHGNGECAEIGRASCRERV